jgi:hypothetical protein
MRPSIFLLCELQQGQDLKLLRCVVEVTAACGIVSYLWRGQIV